MEFILLTFNLVNTLLIFVGVIIGVIFGMLPGLTGVTAIAILMPFSYGLDPVTGLIFMASIYCGSTYSGSISGILFKSPGDAAAIFTTWDGYAMTLKGQAGKALFTDMISSGIGGIMGVVFALLTAVLVLDVALRFGPPEYFSIGILGLALVAVVGTRDNLKGLVSVFIGLFIGIIGLDPITVTRRFVFGSVVLRDGIPLIPMIIGIYAIAEVFTQYRNFRERKDLEKKWKADKVNPNIIDREDVKRIWPHWIRSGIIGYLIGVLPGVGTVMAAFVGYGVGKRTSKKPEEYGYGSIEGVAAPETANNAGVAGSLLPLTMLGIPGSPAAAVILAVFLIHGLTPGPQLFITRPDLVYPIFISMFLANILIVVIPFFTVRYMVKILQVRYEFLGAFIILISIAGAYTYNHSFSDIWVLFFFGVFGFFVNKHGFSAGAIVIGKVLVEIIEDNFLNSMVIFRGDLSGFLSRPICVVIILSAALLLFGPFLFNQARKFISPNKNKGQ